MGLESQHGTLVASTVTTVTITARGQEYLTVTNRDGANAITYVFDDDGTVPANPTALQDDAWVLPAAIGSNTHRLNQTGDITVKLISAGTPAYSVETY